MPEGDTLFRAARTLDRALAGDFVTRFETVLPHLARVNDDAPLAGRTVESARSEGKWLRISFSGDLILLTHMLMSGSWHIYRPGERWRQSTRNMRIAIATAKIIAVAFRVPVAEFHTARSLARRDGFNRLGPAVLGDDFDESAAIARLESHPEMELGTALLAQSLMAGLGNVFKSEVCFVARLNPFRRVGSLSESELRNVVATARKLMLANVADTSGDIRRVWVYARVGEPCRNCGAIIQSHKQGVEARTTFWCPQCQARPS